MCCNFYSRCFERIPTDHDGLFDASACQHDLPVILSVPHFANLDESLREDILGLNPDPAKHKTYFDVYPVRTLNPIQINQFSHPQMTAKLHKLV